MMKNVINARLLPFLEVSQTERERETGRVELEGEINIKVLSSMTNIATPLSAFSSPSKIKAAIKLLTPASVKHRLPGPGKISASETKISQREAKACFGARRIKD